MNEKGIDIDGAFAWLGKYHGEVLSKFQAQKRTLPFWGPGIWDRVAAHPNGALVP